MYPYHPAANAFPMIVGLAREQFQADIAASGQRQKIVMHDDMVLDGRNRYEASVAAGFIPEGAAWRDYPDYFRAFGTEPGDGDDPIAFVLSLNIARRDLSRGERLHAAATLATMRQGHRTDLAGDHPPIGGLDQPATIAISQAEAAEKLGLSKRNVERMVAVTEHGVPELAEMVRADRVSVGAAEAVSRLPEDEQQAIVASHDPQAVTDKARELRDAKRASDPIVRALGDGSDIERRIENDFAKAQARSEAAKRGHARASDDDEPVANRPAHSTRIMPPQGRPYVHFLFRAFEAATADAVISLQDLSALAHDLGLVESAQPDARFTDHVLQHHRDVGHWRDQFAVASAPDAEALPALAGKHTRASAEPILRERYATHSAEDLSSLLGVPVPTIRTWAFRLGLTSKKRISDMAIARNASRAGDTK